MRRLVASLICLLLSLPAWGAAGALRQQMMQAPGWVPKQIDLFADLENGRFWIRGQGLQSIYNRISLTRASVKYCDWLSGLWTQVPSGYLCRTDKGASIEEGRTNDALWSRDLTNAAWTKVGMGTALNAVGIDGAANSATTLTATGTAGVCTASCTALQTITLGSSADTYSVFLKRVTGAGTVNITINNLAGATACTLVTTGFTRCSVTATLANPVIGIQMTALNDVIVADFSQLEPGASVSSPMLTTTVTFSRAADVGVVANPQTFGAAYTPYFKGTPFTPTGYASNQFGLNITFDDNNRLTLFRTLSTGTASYNSRVGGVSNTPVFAVWGQNVAGKLATAMAASDQAGSFNGSAVGTSTTALPTTPNMIEIGGDGSSRFWNGQIQQIGIAFSYRIPNAGLQWLTTLPYLLWRDIEPAANDNSPAFLDKAA